MWPRLNRLVLFLNRPCADELNGMVQFVNGCNRLEDFSLFITETWQCETAILKLTDLSVRPLIALDLGFPLCGIADHGLAIVANCVLQHRNLLRLVLDLRSDRRLPD